MDPKWSPILELALVIGGFRGGTPGTRPPKGPNSFVLTYKFYET